MEITHHVSFNKYSEVDSILGQLCIKFKKSPLPDNHYLLTFDIQESHKDWRYIEKLIKEKNAVDVVYTNYSTDEILLADYCLAIPSFETLYPYPENTWIKNKQNFFKNYCKECGIYSNQVAEFRVSKEPNMRNHQFMTLFWGNLNIFVHDSIRNEFESFSGFEFRNVYIKKTDEKASIAQLVISNYTDPGFVKDPSVKAPVCAVCSTIKFNYPARGSIMYKTDSLKDLDIQQTHEWFGDGHLAYHLPIFSKNLVAFIISKKWTGIHFKPVVRFSTDF